MARVRRKARRRNERPLLRDMHHLARSVDRECLDVQSASRLAVVVGATRLLAKDDRLELEHPWRIRLWIERRSQRVGRERQVRTSGWRRSSQIVRLTGGECQAG